MSTLYLVGTPIGNLEDITLRALRALREVSLIAAEDTRTTRKLLTHYEIRKPLISYSEHNMHQRTPRILAALSSGDVALVSEAGMPGISDPGLELVIAATEAGYPVVAIPGPSAITAALAISGLYSRQFTFLGFLPRRPTERRRLLASLTDDGRTIVAFESPHRLRRTLADMLAVWGDRRLTVCRELTKAFEELFRGRTAEALEHFQEPRGEFTLVVEGALPAPASAPEEVVREELRQLKAQGLSPGQAVSQVAHRLSLPRRDVYRLWVETTPDGPR